MAESLQEFVDSRGTSLRVDPQRGVLQGVKLIGLTSRNGRVYQSSALQKAQSLYEGAKVNVNHPKTGPLSPRDYQDRLGVIREVEFREGDGLFGNLHFNPKHPLAEQLVWDAEHNPRNVGISHNVLARVSREGRATLVEEITHVQSVDLVADPASTLGLYEHEGDRPEWKNINLEQLERVRPDLLEEHSLKQSERHREKLQEAEDRYATLQRQTAVLEMICQYGLRLPKSQQDLESQQDIAVPQSGQAHAISQTFYEMLLRVEDDRQLEQLIQERVELASAESRDLGPQALQVPRSIDQLALQSRITTESESASDFARSLQRVGV